MKTLIEVLQSEVADFQEGVEDLAVKVDIGKLECD